MISPRALIRCRLLAAGLFIIGSAPAAMARDLVYTPVNPSFGGSPLNGSYLLGLAGANNHRFTESPQAKRDRLAVTDTTSAAQQFTNQITASLLSQIASTVGQQILGENARDSGTFTMGSTTVNFNRVGGQIDIDIADAASGGRTNIKIPAPQF
ncbi:curli assembly protein CsgF [Pseudoroseomonas rhizosphaerae]|uniref:Curli production assembly/transport component CsgF n=1 Tax=Teichococcus rhizosphaerae TaxID=1335062 RepID=A0A2C7ACJ1_9PROT|nr:curli assembly protein CsgF [Pseudoroseomonas rhizosphaerae]PHK95383.1 curli assembly protein CsgF [Pseudoroseomonas rhizosphaerae]